MKTHWFHLKNVQGKKLMTLKDFIIEINIVVNVEDCDEIQIEWKWWCLQSINLIYFEFLQLLLCLFQFKFPLILYYCV